jgi:uncharacterized protein YkvS
MKGLMGVIEKLEVNKITNHKTLMCYSSQMQLKDSYKQGIGHKN